jgi:hypothetical protein
MTNRFNKHDFIENQANLDIFDMLEQPDKVFTNELYRPQNSHVEGL